MCDIDKGDPELVVHILEFKLHLFAHLQVQRSQRLIQKEDLRLVDQGACDRDPLLLSAGQGPDRAAFESLEVHQFQDTAHLAVDHVFGSLLLPQPEGDIVIHIHMGKKGIALKDRVDGSFVGRKPDNGFSVQKDVALCGHIKSRDHAECCRLSAA